MSKVRTVEDKAKGLTDADVTGSMAYRHCVHFTGVSQDKCRAGVVYIEQFPTRGKLGCICRENRECPKGEWRTFDEAKADETKRIGAVVRHVEAIAAAHGARDREGS